MNSKKNTFSKPILSFFICFLFLSGHALTLQEINTILSQKNDPTLIAHNLRNQLGRDIITQEQSKAVVDSFKAGGNWQVLVPSRGIEVPAPAPGRLARRWPPHNPEAAAVEAPAVKPKPPVVAPKPAPKPAAVEPPVVKPKPPVVAPKPAPKPAAVEPPVVKPKPPVVAPKPAPKPAAVAVPSPVSTSPASIKEKFLTWKYRSRAGVDYKTLAARAPNIPNHSEPSDVGRLSGGNLEDNLKHWLSRQGLINEKLFKGVNCLEVKENNNLKGSSTEGLFLVSYKPSCFDKSLPSKKKLLFIIKFLPEDAAKKELINLNLLRNYPRLRSLGKVKDPSLPQLTFGEQFFNYAPRPGQIKVIELLHAAKGKDFLSIIFNDALPDAEKVIASQKLGKTLANFQKKFMEGENCKITGGTDIESCATLVHNDFHPGNLFYDGKFIYWIDTEGMALSLKERRSFIIDSIILGGQVKLWGPDYWSKFEPYYNIFLESYLTTLISDPILRRKIEEVIRAWVQLCGKDSTYLLQTRGLL